MPHSIHLNLAVLVLGWREYCRAESARLSNELRLAQDYWLKTIEPYIIERKLRGTELYVAQHAFGNVLQQANRDAGNWNRWYAARFFPIPQVDWKDPRFLPPEPLYGDDLKPEVLAAIAAPFAAKAPTPWASCFPQFVTKASGLSPVEALSVAHDLLIAAERYIASLPKRPPTGTAEAIERLNTTFTYVTFDEIIASNRKGPGCLPLLPPLQVKRKGKTASEITGTQTLEAIRNAVSEELERERPRITETEYDREREQEDMLEREGRLWRVGDGRRVTCQESQNLYQAKIDDCMKHNRLSVQFLCHLRWERFRSFALKQKRPASTPPKRRK